MDPIQERETFLLHLYCTPQEYKEIRETLDKLRAVNDTGKIRQGDVLRSVLIDLVQKNK